MLSLVVALAICALLVNLGEENAKDYTFGCFFLICTTLLLRLRWLVGTTALSLPLLLLYGSWLSGAAWPAVLPADADVHLTVAWAAGALLSYTIESQKRCQEFHFLPHTVTFLSASGVFASRCGSPSILGCESEACQAVPHLGWQPVAVIKTVAMNNW